MKQRHYITKQEEELILELHSQSKTQLEISKIIQCNRTSVGRILKKHNLLPTYARTLTIEDKELIKNLYLNGKTITEIHSEFFKEKCTVGCINVFLRKEGITRPNGKVAIINHDYFEKIDSQDKAYWLGLILADGNVYALSDNSKYLRLELKISDRYLIDELSRSLNSPLKSKEYIGESSWKKKEHNNTPKHNAYCAWHSKKLVDDLSEYGVVPNKTLNITDIPKGIPHNLMSHFIRGYFDGDGTVFQTKSRNKDIVKFGFYGTEDFTNSVLLHLRNNNIGLNVNVFNQVESNVSFFTCSAKEDVKNFYNYIYKDANIFLKRKKEKFEELK
jgi:hypothetical protein